jgi:drug/metabolite transporter (DMT)-like permease
VDTSVLALVLTSACIGAALHGVALALRKHYGEGHEQYYLHWKWWCGALTDAVAGVMIWPAMPLVLVQVLAPLVIVVQLCSCFLIGVFIFKERYTSHRAVGLAFAVAGVVGISLSESSQAAAFPLTDFWGAWLQPHIMLVNALACLTLATCFAAGQRSTFWAIAAAVCEGVQYICSRTIVDSIFDFRLQVLQHPAALAAICIKVCCIVLILHFQQQGLKSDLSGFAGIFLVSCTLFMCIYGSAFFGEELHFSRIFVSSAILTLAGIWMLNEKAVIESSESEMSKSDKDVPECENSVVVSASQHADA